MLRDGIRPILILTSKVSSTLLSQVPPCLTFFRFFFHCPFILLIVSTLESQIAEADEAAAVTKRNVADKIRGMGALADSVKKLEGEVALGQRQKEELERQLSETGNSLRMLQTLPTADLPQVPSLCPLVSLRVFLMLILQDADASRAQLLLFHEEIKTKELKILKLNEDNSRFESKLHDRESELDHLRNEYLQLRIVSSATFSPFPFGAFKLFVLLAI